MYVALYLMKLMANVLLIKDKQIGKNLSVILNPLIHDDCYMLDWNNLLIINGRLSSSEI